MNKTTLSLLAVCLFASAAMAQATWPGNATDFECELRINNVIDTTSSRVVTVNTLDIVVLRFNSPMGATNGQFFSAFYQVMYTGTALTSLVIPGETPPGGFWLDNTGLNPGLVTGVVPYVDGLGFGGPNFLAPVLLPGGSSFSFAVPAILGGQGISLLLQAVVAEPGLNMLGLGIDDCIELQVN
ncbi:MAG: hypothetical protein H6807_16730 [Planctomycetes bacterium]|nr:hypothetical protein [Planctomycetota bacterium]